MKILDSFFRFVFVSLCCVISLAVSAEGVVIVNAKNTNQLSPEEIVRIYLGKIHEFPDGTPVKPIDQSKGLKLREEFNTKVLKRSENELKSHWSTLVFTGNGTPPDVESDDAAVKKEVASNPNAIGYISRAALDESVRALLSF